MNVRLVSISAAIALAAVCVSADTPLLIPAPQEMVLMGGTCPKNALVRYERNASLPEEGYELVVGEDCVIIRASGKAGEFYGRVTLDQIKAGAKDGLIPCLSIKDAPRFRWRGILLDESRHFFGKEAVKRLLGQMAKYKFNRFHWHLTDDQGWRIDVPGYPELVKYGAVRSQSVKRNEKATKGGQEDAGKLNGEKYGPYFYTEEDLKEIIAYAAARHIQVVPEIDLPGHLYAALAAYPEYACFPENLARRDPRLVWGVERDVLCAGNDDAIKFVDGVLDYVCRVFPGDVVHIGGDEVRRDRWKECPKCQARIKAEQLGGEDGLQTWITSHCYVFLASRGKRTIGWDGYIAGKVPAAAIGMSSHAVKDDAGLKQFAPAEYAKRGHDLVMCPSSLCYLDHGQGLREDPCFYIGHTMPLSKCYSFDPCAGIPENLRQHILGGQGNNWTEYTWSVSELEWKMWPRSFALAEVLWTYPDPARRDFAEFSARAAEHRRRMIANHINCAPLE